MQSSKFVVRINENNGLTLLATFYLYIVIYLYEIKNVYLYILQ